MSSDRKHVVAFRCRWNGRKVHLKKKYLALHLPFFSSAIGTLGIQEKQTEGAHVPSSRLPRIVASSRLRVTRPTCAFLPSTDALDPLQPCDNLISLVRASIFAWAIAKFSHTPLTKTFTPCSSGHVHVSSNPVCELRLHQSLNLESLPSTGTEA